MKRRWCSIAALAVLLCGLAGCRKSDPLPGELAGFDEGEQYLSIWVHSIEDTDEGRVYRDAVDRFNAAYDGKYFADIEFVPRNDSGGGYSDKINASVMSGMLPDVLTVDGPNIAAYAANGIIQPLAPLSEEERGAYLTSILAQGTYNDALYALGVMESSVGLYYNRDLLAEAGIEVPPADDPWTWSEFAALLEQLKPMMQARGGYPLDMTFPVGETSIYFYAPFVWSNGGDLVSEDGLAVEGVFNAPENVETMQMFRSFVENGYMSETPIDKLFESGRAAFKFDGAWEVNTVYTSYPDLNLGVAPYVVSDDWNGGRYTPTGSWAFAASTGAEDIEAATELVKYMSGVESGVQMWEKTKTFPSTYEAFAQFDVFSTDDNYRALYEQLSEYGHPRPITPVYPQVSTSFQQVLESVALGGKDAQTELDKAVERINAKLGRYADAS